MLLESNFAKGAFGTGFTEQKKNIYFEKKKLRKKRKYTYIIHIFPLPPKRALISGIFNRVSKDRNIFKGKIGLKGKTARSRLSI